MEYKSKIEALPQEQWYNRSEEFISENEYGEKTRFYDKKSCESFTNLMNIIAMICDNKLDMQNNQEVRKKLESKVRSLVFNLKT